VNISNAQWGMDLKWLREQLDKRGRGAKTELAQYLDLDPTAISKILRGTRKLLHNEGEKIGMFFEKGRSSPPDRSDDYPQRETPESQSEHSRELRRADGMLTVTDLRNSPEDIPVLGTAFGGPRGGDFTMIGDSGLRVRRPPRLIGREDIFALFVQGDSMSPRYEPGELIYCETKRPPQNGDFVVVELQPGPDGEHEAYLKRLVAITPTKVKVSQFNPAKTLEIDRAAVRQVVRVMNLLDMLG
jgi:phage repressor protein C with HTH and peptisase S24 domain